MATVLKAETREGVGKYGTFNLRKQGKIPGVVYGPSIPKNLNVALPAKEFQKLLHKGDRILDLDIAGAVHRVVLKEVQHALFGEGVIHADFRVIAETDIIEMHVDIVTIGEAPGLAAGGVLEQNLHSVTVACMPKDLPERIQIDIGGMEIGQKRTVADLPKLAGVKYITAANIPVVAVVHPQAAEEAAAPAAAAGEAAAAPAEPEVIGEKERAEKAKEKDSADKGGKK